MDDCCESKSEELAALRDRQRSVLVAVLAINLAMFVVEVVAGLLAGSNAVFADSLDMLGDASVYAFSLYVVERSLAWRARAALAKGLIMVAFGGAVLVDAALEIGGPTPPIASVMIGVGVLALCANGVCFALLWRHRADDVNLRSTWLCSRNDLVANAAVLAAAALVLAFHSAWPDIVVGVLIAALFLRTASSVVREAIAELGRARLGARPA